MADKTVIDVDLAGNVKKLIKINKDVQIDNSIAKKVNEFDDYDLLKVTKGIGSLKIIDAELVDEKLLEKEL